MAQVHHVYSEEPPIDVTRSILAQVARSPAARCRPLPPLRVTRADTAPFSPSQRRWWRQNDWFNKPVLTCEAQMCKVGFHQRVDGKSNVGADTHALLLVHLHRMDRARAEARHRHYSKQDFSTKPKHYSQHYRSMEAFETCVGARCARAALRTPRASLPPLNGARRAHDTGIGLRTRTTCARSPPSGAPSKFGATTRRATMRRPPTRRRTTHRPPTPQRERS